jgi:hypothetical protein
LFFREVFVKVRPPIDHSVVRRVDEAIRAALPRSVSVRALGGDSGVDLVVNGSPIQVKWIGEGGLRQARELLAIKRNRPNIVVARRLSPGAREALSNAGVGWIDETGAAEIAFGTLIVSRSGHPEPIRQKPPRWTPAVLAVAEALLCGRKGTVSAIQEATQLSSGGSTKALATLTQLGLLASKAARGRGSAREIRDKNELLDAYAAAAAAMAPAPRLQVGVTWRDVTAGLIEVGKQWTRAGVEWAATGPAAAMVLAPYLTSVTTMDVYVDAGTIPGITALAASVGLQPIEGGRLVLRPFPTVAARRLADEKNGLRVAPWPRVYVDLKAAGVRGEDAAEHLREIEYGR